MTTALPSLAATWGGTGHVADLGAPVHYVDYGGAPGAPRIVFVHGLGGSHLNWGLLAPRLAPHARMLAVDLAGFGCTPATGVAPTVTANAVLLSRFLDEVVGEPAILAGNSMGAMVSLLTATGPAGGRVRGLVLIDPVLPRAPGARPDPLVRKQFAIHAVPGLGEWALGRVLARVPAAVRVPRVYALCCVDAARVPPDMVKAGIALEEWRAAVPGRAAAYLAAARSIVRSTARRERYWRTARAVTVPVMLIHGERDRLVPVESARAAAARLPDWRYEELSGIGHVPQLEAPDTVAELVLSWMDTHHLSA